MTKNKPKGRGRRAKRPDWINQVAKTRISFLFRLARGLKERSKRYIDIALKIGERYNIRIRQKNEFCKKCKTLFDDKTVRIRVDSKRKYVVYTCKVCGHKKRYPINKVRNKKYKSQK